MNEREGVDRFSIVTAGKALTGEEFDKAIPVSYTHLCCAMSFWP